MNRSYISFPPWRLHGVAGPLYLRLTDNLSLGHCSLFVIFVAFDFTQFRKRGILTLHLLPPPTMLRSSFLIRNEGSHCFFIHSFPRLDVIHLIIIWRRWNPTWDGMRDCFWKAHALRQRIMSWKRHELTADLKVEILKRVALVRNIRFSTKGQLAHTCESKVLEKLAKTGGRNAKRSRWVGVCSTNGWTNK
jgi:hypothetical protein